MYALNLSAEQALLLKVSFGYCVESFFGGGDAKEQIVDGGYERGEFSFSLNLCQHLAAFACGFYG